MMPAELKTDDQPDKIQSPKKIVDFNKPKIEIIEPSRVSQTLCDFFGEGVMDASSDEVEELEIIEEDGYDSRFGSEYLVSLGRVTRTNDWVIRAFSTHFAAIEFRFFIIFNQSLGREARQTMRHLHTLFDEHYFDSELEFRAGLENIFRGLETR